MCITLEASRSGYYRWVSHKPNQRDKENEKLLAAIRESHEKSRKLYGLDKIHADVRGQIPCGRNRIYRLMKENGIRSIRPRKYKATTNSKHNLPVAGNILAQKFDVQEINQAWVADISYIPTEEGWLYLATIKDLCSKEIVGWAADSTMTKELAIAALKRAIDRHRPPAGLIHHSDRGVQYASKDYQELLAKHHILPSMSRKGNCYDNAAAETFFSTIKNELVYLRKFRTRAEAQQMLFEYIEIFYNRQRRHATLNYVPPAEFRQRRLEKSS